MTHCVYLQYRMFHSLTDSESSQSYQSQNQSKAANQRSQPSALLKAPEHKRRIISQYSDKSILKIQRFYRLRVILFRHLFTNLHLQCFNDMNNVEDTNSANFDVKLTAFSKVSKNCYLFY